MVIRIVLNTHGRRLEAGSVAGNSGWHKFTDANDQATVPDQITCISVSAAIATPLLLMGELRSRRPAPRRRDRQGNGVRVDLFFVWGTPNPSPNSVTHFREVDSLG
jgi:hypothetical protein